MNTTRHTRFSFTVIAAFVLIASFALVNCGGGGGGDGILPTYTVTYDGNGNTGGSVPIDATAYAAGQTVTVHGNTSGLAKTGYSFGGWNTQADGNGTTYGATFTMGAANVTLYAKWAWTGTKQLGVALTGTNAKGVAVDASGNVYVAGVTYGGLDGNTLAGARDLFLTKYDSIGDKVRTIQTGTGGAITQNNGVAVDANGNVYVAGFTTGDLDGNPPQGAKDHYLIKYDPSGNTLFTKQTGTTGKEAIAFGVAVDASGNVYVTGYTNGGLDGKALTGAVDSFITKYGPTGNKVYTELTGTPGTSTYAFGVAADASGNAYVVGYTTGGLDGALVGTEDFFLVKYDPSGAKVYTRQTGTTETYTEAYGVAVDASGNAYVTGFTAGGLDGNSLTGIEDIFLTKYNSSGTKAYTRQLGVAGKNTEAYGIAVDGSGNAYVTGYTDGGLDGNALIGTSDAFLTKYNSSGTKLFTRQLGVAGADTSANGVALDSSGNAYVAGGTQGGLDGNALTGSADFFVTKYDPAGNKQ